MHPINYEHEGRFGLTRRMEGDLAIGGDDGMIGSRGHTIVQISRQ